MKRDSVEQVKVKGMKLIVTFEDSDIRVEDFTSVGQAIINSTATVWTELEFNNAVTAGDIELPISVLEITVTGASKYTSPRAAYIKKPIKL